MNLHTFIKTKLGSWVVTTLAGLIIAWGIWATNELFAQKTDSAVTKEQTKIICDDIQELKKQGEKRDEKRQQDKDDIMKELLKIQRQLKK